MGKSLKTRSRNYHNRMLNGMGRLSEIYVAIKEIDYIEAKIGNLCGKYNSRRGSDFIQQRALFRSYCHDTIELFNDCFETSMLGMIRCIARVETYQMKDNVEIDKATFDIVNMLWELQSLVRAMIPIKDLPSCKELTLLSPEDIISKAKNFVKSDIVKAGAGALILGSKINDMVKIEDVRNYYNDRLTQLNSEILTKRVSPSLIEQYLLDKFNAEIGYCNLAMFKAGIGMADEIRGLAEIGKKHIQKFENMQKDNSGAIQGRYI